MDNKITKNLIILGAIFFTFALVNNVSAACKTYAFSNDCVVGQGYSQYNYYQQSGGYNLNFTNSYNNQANPYNNSYNNNSSSSQPGVEYNSNPNLNNPYNNSYNNPANPYNSNFSSSQYAFYQQSGYNTNNNVPDTESKTSIVNNYYQTVPAVAKTNTSSTTNTSNTSTNKNTENTNVNDTNTQGYSSGLGASAYGSQTGNDITALSLRGSGSFMPSSIWQWIFVIILILVIVIIARMLTNKPMVLQESHVSHTH